MTIYDYGRSPELWLLALDIASRHVRRFDPSEVAFDVFCWMEANDFDVAFVGEGAAKIVRRDQLASCDENTTLEDLIEDLPRDRCHTVATTMNGAFCALTESHWFVLVDDTQVVGVVTTDDLSKPAASAFVLAHLINLERVLRRLLGTYTNQQISDEPPCRQNSAEGTITEFSDVINRASKESLLLRELDYSRRDYKRISSWAIAIRNDLAHSRGLKLDKKSDVGSIQRFFAVQDLMLRAVSIVEDRAQMWKAIQDSIIIDPESNATYAGPAAIRLPLEPPCYVITAANPYEQQLELELNHHRNAMLRRVLGRRTCNILDVIGQSQCGRWREESYLVTGVAESSILEIAERFGQRAVFKLTETEKVVIAVDGQIKGISSRLA